MATIPVPLEPITPMQDEPDTAALDAQLRTLVESHKVDEARALLASTPGGDHSPWARVLALPTGIALPSTTMRDDFHLNMDWVRAHGDSFGGQWLALQDGGLLDHDPDFRVLRHRLRAAGHEGMLLMQV